MFFVPILPIAAQETAIDSMAARCPIDTIQGRAMYRYTVEKSVGLYRVSKNFGVSQDLIVEANPELRTRGLRFGEVIYIPVPEGRSVKAEPAAVAKQEPAAVAEQEPAPKPDRRKPVQPRELPQADTVSRRLHEPRVEDPQPAETPADSLPAADSTATDTLFVSSDWNDSTAIRLSLLLPFQARNAKRDQGMERFMEFYEGCLLAAYDLQAEGQRVVLDVYDTEKSITNVRQLIDSNSLARTQAVIGLAYPLQLLQAMPWAMENEVPILAPFIDYMEGIESNPYLYLFNSSAEQEAQAMGQWLEARRDSVNCVLVEAKDADIPASVRILRKEIEDRHIPYTMVSVRQILGDSILHALRDSVENIFIFNTEKYSNVQVLIPHLHAGKGEHRITLRAQYSWTRENIPMPLIYTSIFATETDRSSERADYEMLYARYFGHQHVSETPRYDLLGYDLTRTMAALLNDTTACGLQSDIRFEQVAPEGGYINTNVHVIHTNQ
ncbi:MAG: hypothetical protein ACI4BD_04485 [Paludibacteraceae bacterium]